MKFKMAAAAILNLWFLSILVKWSIFGGNQLHLCKISFIYVNRRLSYWCLCKNPRWRLPFVHLKVPCKFRVDRVRTFRDIAIRKFHNFGLKCLFRPPKIMFLGGFDSQTLFFIIETLKRPYLTRKHAFWAINGRDRSFGVTCRREQEYRKG